MFLSLGEKKKWRTKFFRTCNINADCALTASCVVALDFCAKQCLSDGIQELVSFLSWSENVYAGRQNRNGNRRRVTLTSKI